MSGNTANFVGSTELEQIANVGEARADRLREAGFETIQDVANADVDDLAGLFPYAAEDTHKRVYGSAQGLMNIVDDERALHRIMHIGEARADALREAGLETIADVAHADVDVLAELCPYAADDYYRQMVGTAQGLLYEIDEVDVEEHETGWEYNEEAKEVVQANDKKAEKTASQRPVGSDEMRLLLMVGQDKWEDKEPAEARQMVNNALRRFNIETDEIGAVGFPTQFDDVESRLLRDWVASSESEPLTMRNMEEFDVEMFAPNDVPRGEIQWADAFERRDETMLMWATHVVVVESGEYTNFTLNRAPEVGGPVIKEYIGDESWKDEVDDDDDDDGERPTVGSEAENDNAPDEEFRDGEWKSFNDYDGSAEEYKHEGGEPGADTLT